MEVREGLVTLSEALLDVQHDINVIQKYGFAGNKEKFIESLAKCFSAVCFLDYHGEVELDAIHRKMEATIAEHYSEFTGNFNFNRLTPEVVRKSFKVV